MFDAPASLIARSNEEYLLASIQVRGHGRVEQDGRIAALTAGEMAFYDSTRPYTLHFDDSFHQLVVQVPKKTLQPRDTRAMTARSLDRDGPAGVTATFFTSLQHTLTTHPEHTSVLLPHAIGLLSATASLADGARPSPEAAHAWAREQVLTFLRRNLDDPGLDGAGVAASVRRVPPDAVPHPRCGRRGSTAAPHADRTGTTAACRGAATSNWPHRHGLRLRQRVRLLPRVPLCHGAHAG